MTWMRGSRRNQELTPTGSQLRKRQHQPRGLQGGLKEAGGMTGGLQEIPFQSMEGSEEARGMRSYLWYQMANEHSKEYSNDKKSQIKPTDWL
jgi:hypothetical protein